MTQTSGVDPIKRTQNSQIENTSVSPIVREEQETTNELQPVQPPTYADYEAEYVALPSKGVFYRGRFKGLDKLKVRKLSYQDEDILTTKSYYDNGTLFNEILKGVIVDTIGFRAEQLVPVDRDAILMWLRIGAFGKDYVIPHTCEQEGCEKKDTRIWDLADFDMPALNEKYAAALQEFGEVSVTLPGLNENIKITVPSTGRELEVSKMLETERKQMKTERNHLITGRLLSVINCVYSPDGQEIRALRDIYNWMQKNPKTGAPLSIGDSRFLQKLAKDIDVKIDTAKDFSCKHCGHTEEGVALPMSIYFFWPEYSQI